MQAQMTPATAPGIAGLMQGKPQSPTAGLGNVPQRIGAYGEQGLAQKNAVTQDLLDLMAAQKLKAEKEAAARQMQLQAAQQGQPLTVAQSLDQELLGMTKRELVPQQAPQQAAPGVAQASQQQEQQKQAALQRLAQGIARAPGADQVMPQRMAGGGIVAFQEGGEAPSAVDQREVQRILRKSPMMRTPEENAILRQAGLKLEQRQMGPEGIIQRAERGLQQVGPAARQYLTEGAQGLSPEDLEQRSDAGAVTEKIYRMLGGQQARPPVQPDTMQAEEQRLLGRFPAPQMSEPPQAPQQPPMRMPPAQVQSKVPVQGAPAALGKPAIGNITPGGVVPRPPETPPMQPPAAAQPAQAPDIEALIQKTREEEQKRAMDVYGRTDAEKAPIAAEIARLQKPQPEKRWYENIADLAAQLNQQRIQPGQQGIVGGLGRIASAGAQMGQARKTEEEARRKQLFDLQTKLGEMDRQGRIAGYEAGVKGGEAAGTRGLKGRELGVAEAGVAERGRGIDVQAETARLERESREAIAKMDDKTRRYLGDLQARTRQGGQLNPDDFARIRTNATKAVEDRLKADGNWLILQRKDPVAAERQKQEAIEKMSQDLVRFARSGGATATPPTGGVPAEVSTNDPLGIRK